MQLVLTRILDSSIVATSTHRFGAITLSGILALVNDRSMRSQGLTLALAFLQFVQALGVTESGTFRRLPALLLEVPARGRFDAIDEPDGESVGDTCWTSCMECADESSELLVVTVSERCIEGLVGLSMVASGLSSYFRKWSIYGSTRRGW